MPGKEDRDWVNAKYFDELFEGVFLPETLAGFQRLIEKMTVESGIQAIVLGGTEMPLILRDADLTVPYIDTVKAHCLAAIQRMLD